MSPAASAPRKPRGQTAKTGTETESEMDAKSEPAAAESRPGTTLRADARRNRVRVLEAAEAVFAAKGTSASTEEVAKAAGVGVGTVFRHFPTKQSLLEAVYLEHLRGIAEQARAFGEAKPPGDAFFDLFTLVVNRASMKNALADALESCGVDPVATASGSAMGIGGLLEQLLRNAQQAGAVRDDIGVAEIKSLLIGLARAAESPAADPKGGAGALIVVLDGLRPHGTSGF
jgi:AcrR family transcriptional regulator